MTPLAAKIAKDLSMPIKARRVDDRANLLPRFRQDMHCFEISAVAKSINGALASNLDDINSESARDSWRDVASMMIDLFLPSPVTWLEMAMDGSRIALVLRQDGNRFTLDFAKSEGGETYTLPLCDFRACSVFENSSLCILNFARDEDAIEQKSLLDYSAAKKCLTKEQAKAWREIVLLQVDISQKLYNQSCRRLKMLEMARRLIAIAVMSLQLINTPGLIGLKQRDANRALARDMMNAGQFPLRTWSEVVLKHETRRAPDGEQLTGATYHRCLHFVRSHWRHYADGRKTIIPAHWRGDAALGIKQTRYLVQ